MSTVSSNQRIWVWLAFFVLAGAFGVFSWHNGTILLTRHFAVPDGYGALDLQTALASTDGRIQLAAAQRFAELGPAAESALPTIRALYNRPDDLAEIRWYLGLGLSKMDQAHDLLALAAVSDHRIAQQRLMQLPANSQASALLTLLVSLDPDLESNHRPISELAQRLGSLGKNSHARFDNAALPDPFLPPPPKLEVERSMGDDLAEETARRVLETYRKRDMPLDMKRLFVRLGQAAVPPLIEELERLLTEDVSFEFRSRIFRMFYQLGQLARDAAPAIIKAIDVETVNLALREALLALVAVQPVDRAAATAAVRRANDPQRWEGYSFDFINRWCVDAIESLGAEETIAWLITELNRSDSSAVSKTPAAGQRQASWHEARKLGELAASEAAASLERALESFWPEVRIDAALALHRVGGDSQRASETLIAVLDHSEVHQPEDVGLAIVAIGQLGVAAKSSTQSLIELLANSTIAEHRLLAVVALHQIAPDEPEITRLLATIAIEDADASVRNLALRAFDWRLKTSTTMIELPSLEIEEAIELLKLRWGQEAEPQSPGDALWQIWLAKHTLKQAPERATVLLAQWLSNDKAFPSEAMALLRELGDDRVAAIPILTQALRSDQPTVVSRALAQLDGMGEKAAAAFPEIEKLQTSEADQVLRSVNPELYLSRSRSNGQVAVLVMGSGLLVASLVFLVYARGRTWRPFNKETPTSLSSG